VGKGALAPRPPQLAMVGTRSLSSGAHSRDPLALPVLRRFPIRFSNSQTIIASEAIRRANQLMATRERIANSWKDYLSIRYRYSPFTIRPSSGRTVAGLQLLCGLGSLSSPAK
jgi:hypothetical protein